MGTCNVVSEMIQQTNRMMGEITQKNTNKIVAFTGVDPNRVHPLTVCCLNRFFVSANCGKYFLFSELGLIAVQPMISAGW